MNEQAENCSKWSMENTNLVVNKFVNGYKEKVKDFKDRLGREDSSNLGWIKEENYKYSILNSDLSNWRLGTREVEKFLFSYQFLYNILMFLFFFYLF